MGVFTDYIVGSGDDSTINEFIVVGILFYESKAKMRVEHTSVWAADDGIYNVVGHGGIGNTLQYLVVFVEDVVTYAKGISAFTKGLPCRTIRAMCRNHLY